jgi:hypothetical protein
VARERRVVTPYGYVWFVRRRWARRRLAEDDLGELFLNSLVGLLLTWIAVPWLAPLAAAGDRPLLGFAVPVVVLVLVNQLHRPWYVELRRQGLDDAPRRVWRVQGWRRSGRLMGELTAAIRDGRIDNRRAVILRDQDER